MLAGAGAQVRRVGTGRGEGARVKVSFSFLSPGAAHAVGCFPKPASHIASHNVQTLLL